MIWLLVISIWHLSWPRGGLCLLLLLGYSNNPKCWHPRSLSPVPYSYTFDYAAAIVTKRNRSEEMRPEYEQTSFFQPSGARPDARASINHLLLERAQSPGHRERPALPGRQSSCSGSPGSRRVPRLARLVHLAPRPIAARSAPTVLLRVPFPSRGHARHRVRHSVRARVRGRVRIRRARFASPAQPRNADMQGLPRSEVRRTEPRIRSCTTHTGIAPEPVDRSRLRSE